MEAEREVVKVVCPKVPGNDLGYFLVYRDEMKPGEVLFESEKVTRGPGRPRKEDKE